MRGLHLFSPLIGQVEQTTDTQSLIDKIARTPQSTIVIIVAVLTAIRVLAFLLQRGLNGGAIDIPQSDTALGRFSTKLSIFLNSTGIALLRLVLFTKRKELTLETVTTARLRAVTLLGPTLAFINEAMDAVVYAGVFVFLLIRPYLIQAFVVPSGSMISTLHVGDYILANKFVYRFSNPKDGDIVVFIPPRAATTAKERDANGHVSVDFVKRCIGVPGDVIELKNNILYRNGVPTKEPYMHFFKLEDSMGVNFEKIPFSADQRCPTDFKLVNDHGKIIPLQIEGAWANADSTFTAAKYQVNSISRMNYLRSLPPAPIPPGYYLMMGDDRNNSFDGRAWGLVPRNRIVGRADYVWWPFSRMHRLIGNPGIPLVK